MAGHPLSQSRWFRSFFMVMKIQGINFTVFTTFLSDSWKLEQLPDIVAGKMWKALVKYFKDGTDTDFGDTHNQYVYEDFKQTSIRNAMKNKQKNENRKTKAAQVTETVEPEIKVEQPPQQTLVDPYPGDGLF